MPRALITGITGQDGQHLAEFLHEKGYEVYGLMKGQNNPKTGPLLAEFPFIRIVSGDLTDFASLVAALRTVQPDEIYNLGAQSHVAVSFEMPEYTADVDGVGAVVRLASEKGRAAKPGIKLGVCGEHGGDPASIAFFQKCGLDYVSCSAFRVPVARLAAAQAALKA